MYSKNEYKNLTAKYGSYASWAIWDYKDASNTKIIDENVDQLHSHFVLLGLNISRTLDMSSWSNFHDNSYARRLKYACNDNRLRGSYITDIFKDIAEPNAANLKQILTEKKVNQDLTFFNQEMQDIKANSTTQFIVFGSLAAHFFKKYFQQNDRTQQIFCQHYSYRISTDKDWVEGFWKKLNISQDFDETIRKYI